MELCPMITHELIHRIERLERQNRVMKVIVIAGLCVLGLAAATRNRNEDYDVVRARRFTILDDNGKERGYFGMTGTTATIRFGKSPVDGQIRLDAEENRTIQLMTHPKDQDHRVLFVVNSERSAVQADEFIQNAKSKQK
jgi:hypothetical protein